MARFTLGDPLGRRLNRHVEEPAIDVRTALTAQSYHAPIALTPAVSTIGLKTTAIQNSLTMAGTLNTAT